MHVDVSNFAISHKFCNISQILQYLTNFAISHKFLQTFPQLPYLVYLLIIYIYIYIYIFYPLILKWLKFLRLFWLVLIGLNIQVSDVFWVEREFYCNKKIWMYILKCPDCSKKYTGQNCRHIYRRFDERYRGLKSGNWIWNFSKHL